MNPANQNQIPVNQNQFLANQNPSSQVPINQNQVLVNQNQMLQQAPMNIYTPPRILRQIPMQPYPMYNPYSVPYPKLRVPLITPKGYTPKAKGSNGVAAPPPNAMLKSAVRYISPAVYHPGEPGKNVSQNVLSVELASLSRKVELATGDPVRCKQCSAVFCASDGPSLVKVEKDGEEVREWTCKYCGCKQEIDIDDAEIPTSNVSEYVLAPSADPERAEGADSAAAAAGAPADSDDAYVVFCVDVSGSMSVTFYNQTTGEHVSKLACVADAVYSQMDALRHEHPNRRVCLILFGSYVDVFNGVEHKEARSVTLSEWDGIVKFAEDIKVDQPISTLFDALADEVVYMETNGCTALGPALLAAITIAGRKRGSQVVLCTDGLANQGIGSLEGLVVKDTDVEKSEVELLYERFGDTAKDMGVTVSVIGIKGAECRMENLGVVADKSGGNVDLVDPQGINMSGSIEEPVLATGVNVTVRVVPEFVFENGSSSKSGDVGNVKSLSQYQCALFTSPDDKLKAPSEVRIQSEVTFTMLNGAVHLRVIELFVPFKEDIRESVDGIDIELIGGYVSRTAAQMAHDGEVEQAGLFSQGYQDKLNEYFGMQRRVNPMQAEMMHRFTTQNTCAQSMVRSSLMQQRSQGLSNFQAARQRDDIMSTNIYQMRSDAGAKGCLIM